MKRWKWTMVCAAMIMLLPAAGVAEEAGAAQAEFIIDLTGVIAAAAALAFDLLLGWMVKNCLPGVKAWLEERVSESQRKMLYELIEKLVEAAEQVIGAGKGSEKLEYVIEGLRARGVKVDVDLIEAAVKEMNDRVLREVGGALRTVE